MLMIEEEDPLFNPLTEEIISTTEPSLFPIKDLRIPLPEFKKPLVASPPPSTLPKLSKTLPSCPPLVIISINPFDPESVDPDAIILPRIEGRAAPIADFTPELSAPKKLPACDITASPIWPFSMSNKLIAIFVKVLFEKNIDVIIIS